MTSTTTYDVGEIPRKKYDSSMLHTLLVVVYLLGYYLNNNLIVSPGLIIPAIFCGVTGSVLLVLNYVKLERHDIFFVIVSSLIFVFSIVLNPYTWYDSNAFGAIDNKLVSLFVYLYGVISGLGVLVIVRSMSLATISKIFKYLTIIILSICIVQSFIDTSPLIRITESILYSERALYSSAAGIRDVALFGSIRPTAFALEPSDVAKFLFLSVVFWALCSNERYLYFKVAIAILLATLLVKSPISVASAIPVFFVYLTRERATVFRSRGQLSVLLVFAFALLILTFLTANTVLSGRVDYFRDGTDGSAYLRVILPMQMLMYTLSEWPLFGLGFGAKESIHHISEAFWLQQHRSVEIIARISNVPFGQNLIATIFIHLGLIGGFGFVFVLIGYLRRTCGGSWFLFLVVFFSYSMTLSDFSSTRTTGFLMLSIGVFSAFWRQRAQSPAVSEEGNVFDHRQGRAVEPS